MNSVLQSFQEGFPTFLIWTGAAGGMLILAVSVYVLLTPWKELALVKGGNGTAGLALAGAIVGRPVPRSFSISPNFYHETEQDLPCAAIIAAS